MLEDKFLFVYYNYNYHLVFRTEAYVARSIDLVVKAKGRLKPSVHM